MINKLDEKLIAFAFGEVSPVEAHEIQQLIDSSPSHKARFEEYRQLMAGAISQRDVPAHQLSNERLRLAIAEQSAKPRKRFWLTPWVWAPLGTAALAFALTNATFHARPGQVSTPLVSNSVALNDTANHALAPLKSLLSPVKHAETPSTFEKSMTDVKSAPVAVHHRRSPEVSSRSISRRTLALGRLAALSSREIAPAVDFGFSAKSSASQGSPVPTMSGNGDAAVPAREGLVFKVASEARSSVLPSSRLSVTGNSASDGKIVLISATQDDQTGLPIASESKEPDHVLLGS